MSRVERITLAGPTLPSPPLPHPSSLSSPIRFFSDLEEQQEEEITSDDAAESNPTPTTPTTLASPTPASEPVDDESSSSSNSNTSSSSSSSSSPSSDDDDDEYDDDYISFSITNDDDDDDDDDEDTSCAHPSDPTTSATSAKPSRRKHSVSSEDSSSSSSHTTSTSSSSSSSSTTSSSPGKRGPADSTSGVSTSTVFSSPDESNTGKKKKKKKKKSKSRLSTRRRVLGRSPLSKVSSDSDPSSKSKETSRPRTPPPPPFSAVRPFKDLDELVAKSNSNTSGKDHVPVWLEATHRKMLPCKKNLFYPYTSPSTAMQSLEEEMLDFVRHVSPTEEEREMRESLVAFVEKTVTELWPGASTKIYGSFSTNLYLPDSDIDIVVYGVRHPDRLNLLARTLWDAGFCSYCQVIPTAKIPVIKIVEFRSHCRIDICYDVHGGPENAAVIRSHITAYPQLRPLAITLKYFLFVRQLHVVFWGGLSSHALVLLVIHLLKYYPLDEEFASIESGELGARLLQFFKLYGSEFNTVRDVVSIAHPPGTLVPQHPRKDDLGWFDVYRSHDIAIEDPYSKSNVTANCSIFPAIQDEFRKAYHSLLRCFSNSKARAGAPSLLSTIIDPFTYASAHHQRISVHAAAAVGPNPAVVATNNDDDDDEDDDDEDDEEDEDEEDEEEDEDGVDIDSDLSSQPLSPASDGSDPNDPLASKGPGIVVEALPTLPGFDVKPSTSTPTSTPTSTATSTSDEISPDANVSTSGPEDDSGGKPVSVSAPHTEPSAWPALSSSSFRTFAEVVASSNPTS